jgi:outer membrane protein, heavy metal efflux system
MRYAILVFVLLVAPRGATAQSTTESLDSLVGHALAINPSIRAAALRLEASRRRVTAAGARPDPMLMAGIQNLPIDGSSDPMTMRMIGVGQTIPYPGKLALRSAVAQREVDAAGAAVESARRMLVRDVKDSYYDLVFLDQALAVATRSEEVLGTFIQVTEGRYGVGVAGQQDVLKARVEAARLAETAASLQEQRRAALARLNGVLDRPSDASIDSPAIPLAIVRAAISDSAREVRFVSAGLGARVSDSPLPSLAELQQAAIRQSPELGEHEAMIAAQATRLELARKDVLPDFDLSLQYGQRPGLPDMVTAIVSVPIPLQRRRKQDQLVAAADAQLASLHEEHRTKVNEINAEVARLVSELERERTQLALYAKAILPQGKAALASATESYQVGKVEFLTVLDSQATVFSYETDYFRALADFAKNLAELERIVGGEVLR